MSNWKVDFIQELSKISSNMKMRDHRAFIFWYIKATEDIPDEDVNERITDRSKDAGSDAILLDHTTKTIKIIQSKFTPNIGGSPFNKDELNKLNKVCDYLLGKDDYENLREYIHKSLKEKLDVAIRLIKEEQYKLIPIFITTHSHNGNYKIFDNQDLPLQINAAHEIALKYNEWLHGHTPELGDLDFEYLGLMKGQDEPRAYLVNMEAKELRNKYRLFKEKLFSRNVRIYQEKYKPNTAIKSTLTKNPNNFWYFNNGITILAERIVLRDSDNKIVLKNPQIINGCQTVTTIGENKESTAQLFVKIVEVEDNVSNQLLIDGIIEANNRQTPVDERMLKSNHPLQVKLQREFEAFGYYFERKEGQFKEERTKSNRVGKLKCIKNIDIIKTKIAIVKEPHYSFSKEDDLFSIHFNDIFKESNSWVDYLIPYLLWEWIEWFGQNYNRGKKRKGFHRISAYHILRLIFDNNLNLNDYSKAHDTLRMLKDDDHMRAYSTTIRSMIDVAYKVFEWSEFDSGYAERDFLKNKDTYSLITDRITKQLKKEIGKMFE